MRLGDIFKVRFSGRSYDRSRAVPKDRARDALESAGVGLLLLSVAASAIAGRLLFPVLVGIRSTVDAGCAFMLISLGVLVVVGIAQNGPGYLIP